MATSVAATPGLWTLLLLPASWAVHDVEEILTVERWSDARRHHPPLANDGGSGARQWLIQSMASTRRQFTIAAGVVGCIVVAVTVVGILDATGIGILAYTTVLGGYLVHAFVHLGRSLLVRGYTPGVVTATVVTVPASSYLYWWLLSTDLLDVRLALVTGGLGVVLFVPVVLGANRMARRIDHFVR